MVAMLKLKLKLKLKLENGGLLGIPGVVLVVHRHANGRFLQVIHDDVKLARGSVIRRPSFRRRGWNILNQQRQIVVESCIIA